MSGELLLVLQLILVRTADGKLAEINPSEIVAIRPPRGTDHFVEGAKCLIFTTDAKFISASDSCDQIHQTLVDSGALIK